MSNINVCKSIFYGEDNVTVSGTPPLTLTDATNNTISCEIDGQSKRTITIDGVEYVVPDGYTLLNNEGSTATAYYCKRNSDNATGTINLTTGIFTASSFTPGTVLPNPEQPLGVKSCGDRTENLYNKTTTPTIKGYPTQSGTWDAGSYERSICMKLEEGETYTIVRAAGLSSIMRIEASATYPLVSGQALQIIDISGSADITTKTITVPVGYPYVITYCSNSAPYNPEMEETIVNAFMVIKGTTAPTSYIPYGYKVPILQAQNCGMVDLGTMNIAKTAYGCSFEKSDMAQTDTNAYITGYTLGRGDKTFRIVPVVSTVYVGIQDERFADMTIEQIKELLSGKYLYYQRTTDTTWTAPTTIPAYIDKPLGKVGTYADTFDFASGVHTENVGVKVFDGTENWMAHAGIANWFYAVNAVSDIVNTDADELFCSNYTFNLNVVFLVDGEFSIGMGSNHGRAVFKDVRFTTKEEWKAFLAAQYAAGTPVTVWYPLATPVTTQHTAVPVTLAKGTNYLDVETVVKPSNVEVTYRKAHTFVETTSSIFINNETPISTNNSIFIN